MGSNARRVALELVDASMALTSAEEDPSREEEHAPLCRRLDAASAELVALEALPFGALGDALLAVRAAHERLAQRPTRAHEDALECAVEALALVLGAPGAQQLRRVREIRRIEWAARCRDAHREMRASMAGLSLLVARCAKSEKLRRRKELQDALVAFALRLSVCRLLTDGEAIDAAAIAVTELLVLAGSDDPRADRAWRVLPGALRKLDRALEAS